MVKVELKLPRLSRLMRESALCKPARLPPQINFQLALLSSRRGEPSIRKHSSFDGPSLAPVHSLLVSHLH